MTQRPAEDFTQPEALMPTKEKNPMKCQDCDKPNARYIQKPNSSEMAWLCHFDYKERLADVYCGINRW